MWERLWWFFKNGLWHMGGRRTQHWITVAAAHIRFFCCLFSFFVMSEDKFWYPLSPSSHYIFSFSHKRAGPDCRCGGGGRGGEGGEGGGKVIFFESENVESLSAFFSGCCSEAAGWRTLLNRNRERDALIKKPDERARTQTHHPGANIYTLLMKIYSVQCTQ